MNCRESKVAIALHLGHDDSDPSDWEQARRHASICDDCHQHYKNVKKSMAVLEQADVERTYDVQESLWPEIESRLSGLPGQKRDETGRSRAPFISLTVACLLFLMVWANPPQEPDPNRPHNQAGRSVLGGLTNAFQHSPNQDQQADEKELELEKDQETL